MKPMLPVVLVSEASMPGLAWNERRNSALGWAAKLQGLIEAGAGKTLRVELNDDKRASSLQCQLRTKARNLNIKIEFARADKFLFVRIAGVSGVQKAVARPAAITGQSEADGRTLIDLVWTVLKGRVRWITFASLAGVVSSMDAPTAKNALPVDIRQALDLLVKSGLAVARNEEGIWTWRAKKVEV